ncbi:F-box/WD repeat-containing protein 9-like [Mizuhopecten yessoensis]|uniref:F-box/WD repeat-containing protein 9-like n=1 Tax=Mizuhopecten yessoensis TaxID=6573 RepID=UPI000B459D5C|nr:F-box/WD repeat-containing protein 9-like [Mizuhopecten yessoensis]
MASSEEPPPTEQKEDAMNSNSEIPLQNDELQTNKDDERNELLQNSVDEEITDGEGNDSFTFTLLKDLEPGCLTLDTLPAEILMHIFNFLDAKFIVETLGKVCVLFSDLFCEDTYWKLRISKRWPKQFPPVYEENFNWMEACVEREEQHQIWSKTEETCVHFSYREGIFASVDTVHLMKGGKFLATGSRDRYLNLLDLTKYDEEDPEASKKAMNTVSTDKKHKGWIWSLASYDDTLCSGSWDCYIKMWDMNAGLAEINQFKCKSAILGLHAEPNWLVGAGYNQFLYMIDPRYGTGQKKKFHRRPVLCVVADDKYIISGSEDKTMAIYDRRAARVYKTIQTESYAMDLSFSHNQLWMGDKEGKVHLYDTTHGRFEKVESYDVGHSGKVTGVHYTTGALFTCSTDKTIKVLEPNRNPGVITTLDSHRGEVARLSYQNGTLASAGSDVTVQVWIPKTIYQAYHS